MRHTTIVTWDALRGEAHRVRIEMDNYFGNTDTRKVFGVPRGGCAIAPLLGIPVDNPEEADYICDDLIDSGRTCKHWKAIFPGKPFVVLFNKLKDPDLGWLVFPWEESVAGSVEDAVTRLIQFVGEDPEREGLKDTPARVARAYKEMTQGYDQDPVEILAAQFDVGCDEMVVVRDIPFYSLCEHHMLPFHGTATVGYVPGEMVVGLSKLARLVRCYAARLQVQERMTQQIAEAMMQYLEPIGAACVIQAVHLCMGMRGIRSEGATVTSCLLGVMKDEAHCRSEFLSLARQHG